MSSLTFPTPASTAVGGSASSHSRQGPYGDAAVHHNNGHVSPHHNVDNPMPHVIPEGENAAPLEVVGSTATDKLAIIMVGLPATGKTHIAKRICRFLSFFHDIPAQIFNVGDYRRQLCGAQMPAEFYDPNNTEGAHARLMACNAALEDMMDYLRQDGVRVAAFDATNSTRARRQHIVEQLKRADIGCKRMFVESICDDTALLEENIRKVKLSTPDYRDMNPEEAIADFMQRRANYQKVYEEVTIQDDGPHVKIINSRQFHVNNIRGYLPLKVVHFVMNLHTLPRTFYLTRHGQSEYNTLGKIGGDSGLSPAGKEYARRLAVFAEQHISQEVKKDVSISGTNDDGTNTTTTTTTVRPCRLWTSTLRRTKETAQYISHPTLENWEWDNGDTSSWVQFRPMARRNLDELYAGVCDGMTYKEIEEVYPDEFARRQDDKLAYRYPRGESYMDVTLRLEPVAQEMERTREPILIIGHQGILRILYAYFMGLDRKEAPYVSIPLNNVIQLTPHAYGCHEQRYCLMSKDEMLIASDGQDEPVTSMPVKGDDGGKIGFAVTPTESTSTTSTTTAATATADGDGGIMVLDGVVPAVKRPSSFVKRATSELSITGGTTTTTTTSLHSTTYDSSDPVMNAPSC